MVYKELIHENYCNKTFLMKVNLVFHGLGFFGKAGKFVFTKHFKVILLALI